MAKPYSKEQQIGKKAGTKSKNKSLCSDGKRVTQDYINAQLTKVYATEGFSRLCQCCEADQTTAHDHTISQAKCKKLGLTDLIWNPFNWSDSCSRCHTQWESYKSGLFQHHKNVIERMLFVKKYDRENYNQRLQYITNSELLKHLEG